MDEARKKVERPVYVTQPFLPPLEEFKIYLEEIWKSKWVTNRGKFHQEFEQKLADFLGVKFVSLFSNGTLALITALQALRLSGEVITTPYSFVATTHALHWNRIKPVFVDIEPDYCNLDPDKIEAAITPETTAILPVHVYGNPCQVEKIGQIADVYGLKVIYDACHAFAVTINGQSILNFGDLSVLSFHGTKVFTTFEGGAIVCHDQKTKQQIDFLKNFGFADEMTVVAPGINAKMNEFQAALGILQLKYFEEAVSKRTVISDLYKENLRDIGGIHFLKDVPDISYNYAYFPIFIDENKYGHSRDFLYEKFKEHNIFSRRYFYPLISQFPSYSGLQSAAAANLPHAEKIASQVLCLPIYPDLSLERVDQISSMIKDTMA